MDLRPLYERALGAECPGTGKIIFRVASDKGFHHRVKIVMTDRGTSVVCRCEDVLEKLRRVVTAQVLRYVGDSDERATEILSVVGPVDRVEVAGTFYVTPELFRPFRKHQVWRLDSCPCDADAAGKESERYVRYGAFSFWREDSPGCRSPEWQVLSRGDLLAWPENERRMYVANLYTDPEHRCKGLGKAVASGITEEILSRGKPALYGCALRNKPSVAVCRALGYVRLSTFICTWECGKTTSP